MGVPPRLAAEPKTSIGHITEAEVASWMTLAFFVETETECCKADYSLPEPKRTTTRVASATGHGAYLPDPKRLQNLCTRVPDDKIQTIAKSCVQNGAFAGSG